MSRIVSLPPQAELFADGALRGGWWHVAEPGRIVCDLCPRECSLKPGDRGFCFVRENRDGEMALSTFGRSTGFCIDPIEKKPLNHFYPGTPVLSFGTAGCNLGCQFCQNWDISKSREVARLSEVATPEMIAAAAQEHGCRSVAYTYNDPIVWAEYAIATAAACRAVGIKSVAVTAGYISPSARAPFFHAMDAANVDLKAFDEAFYRQITYSQLQPVLDTLTWLKNESDVWFEITNLVIPDANDGEDDLRRMCDWILQHVGDSVPVHFSAFHPDFRMQDRPRTPHATLLKAYEIARQQGLQFVYVGNVNDVEHQSTYCPACQGLLIERNWYQLGTYQLQSDRCAHCNTQIAGHFDEHPGTWGRQRQPVRIAAQTPQSQSSIPADRRTEATVSVQEESMSTRATNTTPIELSAPQRRAVHQVACEVLAATTKGRSPNLSDMDWHGADKLSVMGAFVTVKRHERLRGCCGTLGQVMSLSEAVLGAAQRTASDDPRLPPLSPTELRHLHVGVTLLSDFEPVRVTGRNRIDAVTVGQHGLRIARGEHAGLLLPSVAVDNGWDAETFLQQVCRKAKLPVTAWEDEATELLTFAGTMLDDDFAVEVLQADDEQAELLLSADELARLRAHCKANLSALVTGATPNYYVTGCSDGTVAGVGLCLHTEEGQRATFSKFSLRPGLPLQATVFALLENAARWCAQRIPNHALPDVHVDLVVFADPAMHGNLMDPDWRGLDPATRAILATEGKRSAWLFDAKATDEQLGKRAAELLQSRLPTAGNLFSVAYLSSADEMAHANVPQPQRGSDDRPAAVAGTFYPADVDAMRAEVEALLADAPETKRVCSAVMVPHAGWKYSGHIAGAVFKQIEIPETVIVLSPKHTPHGVDWAVAPHTRWQIPGGSIAADPVLAKQLADAIEGLELDAAAHAREHGIEVELPLIAALQPDTRIVGITMGAGNYESCQRFAEGLSQVISAMDTPPLLVVSSDLNHYATDEENRRLDELALAALETLDPLSLYQTVVGKGISMCGILPCVTVVETLRRLEQVTRVERIAYATSADVSHDPIRVVGYAGVLLQ